MICIFVCVCVCVCVCVIIHYFPMGVLLPSPRERMYKNDTLVAISPPSIYILTSKYHSSLKKRTNIYGEIADPMTRVVKYVICSLLKELVKE